jgi:hypothetical protein
VTHQALAPITTPAAPMARSLARCAICGLLNLWTNPYYPLVRQRKRRRRSARVQISTFSDDR